MNYLPVLFILMACPVLALTAEKGDKFRQEIRNKLWKNVFRPRHPESLRNDSKIEDGVLYSIHVSFPEISTREPTGKNEPKSNSQQKCLHGKLLVNTTDSNKEEVCKCDDAWEGDLCQYPICQHGGFSAMNRDHKSICICTSAFFGNHCEIEKCQAGQWNTRIEACICEPDFAGLFCDQKCVHGQSVLNSCICDTGYKPPTCEECLPDHEGEQCKKRRSHNDLQNQFLLAVTTISLLLVMVIWLALVGRRRRRYLLAMSQERNMDTHQHRRDISLLPSFAQMGDQGFCPHPDTDLPPPDYANSVGMRVDCEAPPPSYDEALLAATREMRNADSSGADAK